MAQVFKEGRAEVWGTFPKAPAEEDEGISGREHSVPRPESENADTFWDTQIDPFGRHGGRKGQRL